jgi:hypothetical protein
MYHGQLAHSLRLQGKKSQKIMTEATQASCGSRTHDLPITLLGESMHKSRLLYRRSSGGASCDVGEGWK